MKYSFFRYICPAGALCVSAAFLFSCTNEDYDLDKGIDTTVGINGNISLPVGSTGNIAIKDFLEISDGSLVQADPVSGDYSIKVGNQDPIVENITLDRINIGPEDLMKDGGVDMEIDVHSRIKNIYGLDLPDNTVVSGMQITGMKAFEEPEITVPVEIDEDVSGMADILKAVGTVTLDAPASVDFTVSEGAVTYNSGFSIEFPEYIRISVDPGVSLAEVRDGHILYFKQKFRTAAGETISVPIHIDQLDVRSLQEDTHGQQGLVDGRIYVDQVVALKEVYFDIAASDFGTVLGDMPENVTISVAMNVHSADVTGATVVIDPDMVIEDQSFAFGDLPEFLTDEGNVLDLYNPGIMIDVGNTSPFSAMVYAELNGIDEAGSPLLPEPVAIGSTDSSSPDAIFVLPGNTMIYISAKGTDLSAVTQPEGYNPPLNVIDENLAELVRSIPHELDLSNIKVMIPHEGNQTDGYADSDYVEIDYPEGTSGIVYDFSLDYEVNIPLSFGEEFRISYPFDISGISGSLGNSSENNGENSGGTSGEGTSEGSTGSGNDWTADIGSLVINFTLVNAIPFEMSIDAVPIDVDGNEIPQSSGLQISVASPDGGKAIAAAGNIGNEAATRLSITGHVDNESLKLLDGFRLNISASVPSASAGVCLNQGQYFRIEDMSASIQGKGTIELNL